MAQAASMRGQAAAAFDRSNKKNGNPKKSGGDLHALMAQVESMSKTLAKAIKKQTPKTHKKRKRADSDSEDESNKNLDHDSFHLDLEETSLNAKDSDDDISEIDWDNEKKKKVRFKQEIGKTNGLKLNKLTFDKCLNLALSRQTFVRAATQSTKHAKIAHLMPITFGRIQTMLGRPKTKGIRILSTLGRHKLM